MPNNYITSDNLLAGVPSAQTANRVYSGPAGSGTALPEFRALVAADVPNLDTDKLTTGLLPGSRGGTGVDNSGKTLTVPASGTAALLEQAQTFTQPQTLQGGTFTQALTINATYGGLELRPASSGLAAILRMVPNGTPSGALSSLEFYGNDAVAVGFATFERVRYEFSAGAFQIVSEAGGSGTVRPIALNGAPVQIGQHLELREISPPAAPAADRAVLYLDDSGGTTRLRIRFANGVRRTLATSAEADQA